MNSKQRYLETILFGHPDRIPLAPGWPRESTLKAWHAQGLDEGESFIDALCRETGAPREAFDGAASLPTCTRMIPTFEEKVLEHRAGHYIVQDWMGAITEISDTYDYTYIRTAKDFVTRKWHRFPIQTRADWEEKMRGRYAAIDPQRFSPEFWEDCQKACETGLPVTLYTNGPFWQMREWAGMEGLCMLMATDPKFVQEMADFWQAFTLQAMQTVLERVGVDILYISEDMAYKEHSMISPKMARKFLQPVYLAWRDLARDYNIPILAMDSDGYVGELIPIWIESGFNVCDPLEVAAGNDIAGFRHQFGHQIAYRGGIDKRAIAAGGKTMRQEVQRILPVLKDGGYIPGCDHGVPPDISWGNFIEYTRLLGQITGWL